MAKKTNKKARTSPAVCGTCMGPIDRAAVEKAIRENTGYVHACGRVLVRVH